MTDQTKKRRKLSAEILAIFALCFSISLVLYFLLTYFGGGLIEEYCFYNDIYLDEFETYRLDSMVLNGSLVVCVCFFIILFFALFGERLAYIRTITRGVDAMQRGSYGQRVVLKGNNELTQLAEAVNYLSETEERIKAKERKLNEEKEELIRTLSHDIRTPLTSIMSYTELLQARLSLTPEEQKEYLALVSKKTAEIKALTDILLDGGKRSVEYFEDARLLIEQLAEEFEETLEETSGEQYRISVTLSPLPAFSGSFDIREMRRIFSNLISNIQKYADPSRVVSLSVSKTDAGLVIRQKNGVKKEKTPTESHQMGINSIRRIAHNYGGTVERIEDGDNFEIVITLSDL
ncbi:MAG: HAMP domain-containing histidine kinase [Clostridia bacterium]|nr:HAMP domain-containing histidine kinase [Clostridia bacterium]